MSRHHQLDRIIGKAESLHSHLTLAIAWLDREIQLCADIHANDYSTNKTSSRTHEWTPTEAAGNAIAKHEATRRYILETIDAAERNLAIAAQECQRLTHTKGPGPTICDGRGLEGFHDWGEPCDRPADKAGLCSKHYMRCYRWRRDHGLRELDGSAA